MASAREQAGLASYAVTRWPAVVGTLVLLGAPPSQAHRLACRAVEGFLEAPVTDDLGAALLGEVVEAWDGDRDAWWHRPPVDEATPELAEVLDVLDRLAPASRARLLLGAVGRLAPEQVDAVVLPPTGEQAWSPTLVLEVARVAEALPTDPPDVGLCTRAVRARMRARSTAWAVGLAAAVAAAAAATIASLDATRREPEPAASGPGASASGNDVPGLPVRAPTIIVRGGGDLPADWYDGDFVHVAGPDDRTAIAMDLVKVERLLTMTSVEGAVAGVREDGTVVLVRDGTVDVLGRARLGTTAAGSRDSPAVAWLDVDGDLAVADGSGPVIRTSLPLGARLLVRTGNETYVALRQGHLVVGDDGTVRRHPDAAPLDVAGGVRLEADRAGLRIVGPDSVLGLPGVAALGARLSGDGRYLLTSGAAPNVSAPMAVVIDTRTGAPVDLPVPDDGRVVEATIGRPGILTLVLSRPDGARFPSAIPRGNGSQPGYDLVTCRLGEGTCEVAVQFDAFDEAPLVAR